jgi:hypothetical protein
VEVLCLFLDLAYRALDRLKIRDLCFPFRLAMRAEHLRDRKACHQHDVAMRVLSIPHDDDVAAIAGQWLETIWRSPRREHKQAHARPAVLSGLLDFGQRFRQRERGVFFCLRDDPGSGRSMLGPKLDDGVALLAVPDQPGRGASGSRDVACLLAERLNESKDRSLEVIAVAGRAISLLLSSSHLRQPLENLALEAIVGLALRLDDLEQFPSMRARAEFSWSSENSLLICFCACSTLRMSRERAESSRSSENSATTWSICVWSAWPISPWRRRSSDTRRESAPSVSLQTERNTDYPR